jgi:GH15 family glucan-1,4-alpha-glucosidase
VSKGDSYPAIAEYALIGDSHTAALVSRTGSIDWACIPRLDSGACFARLLDRGEGGYCAIDVGDEIEFSREYLEGTLVLATTLRGPSGEALLLDCLTLDDKRPAEGRRLLRIVEGKRGDLEFRFLVAPRFDYGAVSPFIRQVGPAAYTAIGGDEGLAVWSDCELQVEGESLEASGTVRAGERRRLSLTGIVTAHVEEEDPAQIPSAEELDAELEGTIKAWRRWSQTMALEGKEAEDAALSARVLKALTYEPSGAIAAAATTSLPEAPEADRNWDYRFSWIRDSALAVRSFADLGYEKEADSFRRFVERSAAGNVSDLQIVFGLGGERRLSEEVLDQLEGYRGWGKVRIGNDASTQTQLDAYGQLLDLAWRWYERGHEPDDEYWRFLVDLVDAACERWQEPDAGLWEWRGKPRHFVHSKALCWVAVDRGLRLAKQCMRKAPERRWKRARDEIRTAVEREGYDSERGTFVQAFGEPDLDTAALRLPAVGFIDYEDERMIGTVDAIIEELEVDGLLRRHNADDGLDGEEAAFVATSFWLVECLARQGRTGRAREAFDRAAATSNDLGLFSEQFDPERQEMLGNFPQALSHLSHIEAALALKQSPPPGA